MIKFLVDVFCADTIVGLSKFSDIKADNTKKNKLECLFSKQYNRTSKFNFTDPIACHL